MSITRKGAVWEGVQSLYVVFAFVPFLHWLSFVIAGFASHKLRWKVWGAIYFLTCAAALVLSSQPGANDKVHQSPMYHASSTALLIFMFGWFISMGHALRIRREYLLRLEAIADARQQTDRDRVRGEVFDHMAAEHGTHVPSLGERQDLLARVNERNQKILALLTQYKANKDPALMAKVQALQAEGAGDIAQMKVNSAAVKQQLQQKRASLGGLNATVPAAPRPSMPAPSQAGVQPPPVQVPGQRPLGLELDLNTASEAELAGLPGVGPILARRAVQLRESLEGFDSVDQFGEQLDIQPHVVEAMRPLVRAHKAGTTADTGTSSGRVVDF